MKIKATYKLFENDNPVTEEFKEVMFFEFFFIDDIPCLSLWFGLVKDNSPKNCFTISDVTFFEND